MSTSYFGHHSLEYGLFFLFGFMSFRFRQEEHDELGGDEDNDQGKEEEPVPIPFHVLSVIVGVG